MVCAGACTAHGFVTVVVVYVTVVTIGLTQHMSLVHPVCGQVCVEGWDLAGHGTTQGPPPLQSNVEQSTFVVVVVTVVVVMVVVVGGTQHSVWVHPPFGLAQKMFPGWFFKVPAEKNLTSLVRQGLAQSKPLQLNFVVVVVTVVVVTVVVLTVVVVGGIQHSVWVHPLPFGLTQKIFSGWFFKAPDEGNLASPVRQGLAQSKPLQLKRVVVVVTVVVVTVVVVGGTQHSVWVHPPPICCLAQKMFPGWFFKVPAEKNLASLVRQGLAQSNPLQVKRVSLVVVVMVVVVVVVTSYL